MGVVKNFCWCFFEEKCFGRGRVKGVWNVFLRGDSNLCWRCFCEVFCFKTIEMELDKSLKICFVVEGNEQHHPKGRKISSAHMRSTQTTSVSWHRGAHCRQTNARTHVTSPIVKAVSVQSSSQKNKHFKQKKLKNEPGP